MEKTKRNQQDKFKQAARDLKTDNDEKRFDKLLGKIAKPVKPKPEKKPEKNDSH